MLSHRIDSDGDDLPADDLRRTVHVPGLNVDRAAGAVMRARTRMMSTGSGGRSAHSYM